MHRIFSLLILCMMTAQAAPEPLDSYRWKNRLVLVDLAGEAQRKELAKQWRQFAAGIADRDLLLVDLSDQALGWEGVMRPEPEALAELRKWAKLSAGEASAFVLVGKDGGIKSRQRGSLDLKAFFALIDTMPMRQREMENRN